MLDFFRFQPTSNLTDLSDEMPYGCFSGNLRSVVGVKRHRGEDFSYPTRLVEETPSISMSELRRVHGKQKLLAAIRNAYPVQYQIGDNCYTTYLTYDSHRLPGKQTHWSEIESGNVRIYMSCPRCRCRVRKLYFIPGIQTDTNLSDIACRICHGLCYKSQHSSNRLWWKNVAMPLKRLLRQREQILSRDPNPKGLAELERIHQSVLVLRNRVRSSTRYKRLTANPKYGRRPYKDIDLLLANAGCF